jgi:hypothetical protein
MFSNAEIAIVLRLLDNGEPANEAEEITSKQQMQIESICALLAQNFGGTPEYWRWGEEQEVAGDYIKLLNDQSMAESGRASSGMTPSEMDAQRRYDYAVQCLRVKYLGAEKCGYAEVFANG